MTVFENLYSTYFNGLMLTSFTCIRFSVIFFTTSEIISLDFVFLVLYIVFHSIARCTGFTVSVIIILEHCQLRNINYQILCGNWTFTKLFWFVPLHWRLPSMWSPNTPPHEHIFLHQDFRKIDYIFIGLLVLIFFGWK